MSSRSDVVEAIAPASHRRLSISDLGGYLLGREQSIRAAAQDRSTLGVGLLFVAAAGLAREYDAEDLLREPWHLLIPLGASIPLSLVSFGLIATRRRNALAEHRSFWVEYCQFLGLFWLTAPLALLYGIPYERMLAPANAVYANLWTLAVVSVWRVALMVRVTSLLTGRSSWASFWLVMAVADGFASIAAWAAPLPVLQLMGGIQLTEAELTLQAIGFNMRALTILTLPVWVIGALVVRLNIPGRWDVGASTGAALNRGPMLLAVLSIAIWLIPLPVTQREQQLRSRTEDALRGGDLSAALREMSQHQQDDFPPHWDPPPRLGWAEPELPEILDVIPILIHEDAAEWVRAIYLDKFERRWLSRWTLLEEQHLERIEGILDSLPEGDHLRTKHADALEWAHQARAQSGSPNTQPSTTRGTP